MAYAKDQGPVSLDILRADALASRNFDAVPVVDFSGMASPDIADRQAVAHAIREACTQVGFFHLAGHGVQQDLIDRAFAAARDFFAAPDDRKRACDVANSAHACGYVPLCAEDGDLHEAFDCVSEDREIGGQVWRGDFRQSGNQWPVGMPDLRSTLEAYSDAMRQLARRLFGALALALDLPEDHFAPHLDHPLGLLRILNYPHQDQTLSGGAMGAGAHTDHECVTILSTDGTRALQVCNGAGEWLFVPHIPGTFVINIGDQMARWSNGHFVSTLHRVLNLSGRGRQSIAFFAGPDHETTITALPGCIGPDRPALFPPIVAGEYVMENILSGYGRVPSGTD